jgi:drug/metabolite transporter (DMT)-like permease
MSVEPVEDSVLKGIILMVLAFLVFTGIDTSAKWLALAGLAPLQIVFVRYAGHALISLLIVLPQEGRALFHTRNMKLEILRGVFLLGSTVCNFTAVKYLSLTLTTTIFFASPLIVCALSIPFLGEKVGPRRWAAIIVGFIGVLIATQPWGAEAHWAILFSLCAVTMASFYMVLTRRLAGVDSAATQQFYSAWIATILIAPFALGTWAWPEGTASWAAFCLIGFFGWSGHQLLVVAHRCAPASTLAPFVYVFNQPPEMRHITGAAIILLSGLYVWMRERTLKAEPGIS